MSPQHKGIPQWLIDCTSLEKWVRDLICASLLPAAAASETTARATLAAALPALGKVSAPAVAAALAAGGPATATLAALAQEGR